MTTCSLKSGNLHKLEDARLPAAKLQAAARQGANAQGVPFGSRIQDEVVVLAAPCHAMAEMLQPYATRLSGKILVDITNPVKATFIELATPPDSSDSQEIACLVSAVTRMVKAFNTIFAGTLVKGQVAGQTLDVFITRDDDSAKAMISQLVEAGGLRAIDVEPLAHAHYLEGLGFLGMKLNFTLGTQFQSAWKLLA